MRAELRTALDSLVTEKRLNTKGALALMLTITDQFRELGLPLDPEKLLTGRGGQVRGAGGPAAQAVLARHGITRTLSAEGGRTSRGSIENMRAYLAVLNKLATTFNLNVDELELYWVNRVKAFFASQPIQLRLEEALNLRSVARLLLREAAKKEKDAPGTHYRGAVMQHLVGAKLDCVLGADTIEHHGFSTSDSASNRSGDFHVGDVAIHVTTAPTEALIAKCKANIGDGIRPIIITSEKGASVAQGLAENSNIADNLDIFEIEQFIALNLYELTRFENSSRRVKVEQIITRYNEIVEQVETDPSLRIAFKQ
jgi:hypothetical protein